MRAVIFDLANTIVEKTNTENPRVQLRDALGLPSVQFVRNLIYTVSADAPGMTSSEFTEALMRRTGNLSDSSRAKIHEIFERHNDAQRLRPDAVEVFETLRSRGYKLALITNCTPFARELVERLDLVRWFETLILSSDLGLMKPDPRIFQHALTRLQVAPDKACVVGDKVKTDIVGGTLAGCSTVLFEVRAREACFASRLPVYAMIRQLNELISLPLFN